MAKSASSPFVVGLTTLLFFLSCGICQSEENDFSLGCFKQTTSETPFNITAGDYVHSVNLTGGTCVKACSVLDVGIKFAAVTVNGVCLCSQNRNVSLDRVLNSSCLYPQSDGLYYKVYTVVDLPTLEAPSSVTTLNDFNVTIYFPVTTTNCSYTLDFDDGIKKIISKIDNTTTVSHYYASAGKYEIKLSSSPQCMPQAVTTNVTGVYKEFGNVSFKCPKVVEKTENASASCILEVLKAAGANINSSVNNITTLADTVVETIGPRNLEESGTISILENGTYVMPLSSAINDGILVGFQMNIESTESITVQILSPVCTSNHKACRGGCVALSDPCTGQKTKYNEMLSFCSVPTNVSTESKESTTYNVSSEIVFTSTDNAGSKLMKSSVPVSIKRGDVLAFHISKAATIPMIQQQDNSSYVLVYCGQKFSKGQTISVSDAETEHLVMWFRLHVISPVFLEIPIELKPPSVHYVYKVSSETSSDSEIVGATVFVQERISGLKILSPRTEIYYMTDVNISCAFNVTSGTNVTYTVDPDDGTVAQNTTSNWLNHVYKTPGNYTFHVTASNLINAVNASQNVSIAEGVKNLKFTQDPRLHPGEVGKPYQISFSIESGDSPTFFVQYGNNVSMFYSCEDDFNNNITTNVTYTKVDIYNITVSAYGLAEGSKLTINSTVEIMSPVKNLSVTIDRDGHYTDTVVNKSRYLVHRAGKPIHFKAEVETGSPINFRCTLKMPGRSSHSPCELQNNIYTIEADIVGLWKVEIVAENNISKVSCAISIDVEGPCVPRVSIYDQRSQKKPFQTNRGSDIRINTEIAWYNESCSSTKIPCFYNWTLYLHQSNGVVLKQKKDFFVVEKGKLKPGFYRLELAAVCNDTQKYTFSEETFLDVEASNVVARIKGGLKRDAVATNGLIEIDASESYDPDVKQFNSSGLTFRWNCSNNCRNVTYDKNDISVIKINVTKLPVNANFTMNVTVTSSYSEASAAQTIIIADPNAPTTEIICRINCLELVNPNDRLSLEGRCLSCNRSKGDVLFTWTLVYQNGTKVQSVSVKDTTTGFNKENIVLSPGVLMRGFKYELHLTAERKNLTTRSVYSFETARELTGGKCEISPLSGTAALDKFQVKCFDWKGGKAPLIYDVKYRTSVKTDTDLNTVKRTDYEWILWYHGEEERPPARKLPAGLKEEGYKIPIVVEIRGGFGAYVKRNLTVEVNQQELNRDKLLNDINDLKSIDGAVNPQELVQKVTLISQILNDGQNSSKDSEDKSETSNEKIRQALVEELSNVKTTTLPLIKQTSDAIKHVTSKKTEVIQETQVSAVTTLKKMSENLLKIATNPGRRTGQEIDETAGTLLSTLSEILDASVFTGRDTSKVDAPKLVKKNLYGTLSKKGKVLKETGDKTEDVIEFWDKTFEKVTAAMSKSKLIGEKATTVNTSNFFVEINKVDKQWKDKGIKENVSSGDGTSAKISLPSLSSLGLLGEDKKEQIFTEMIYFDKNPYTWDIQSSRYIQPRIFSFTFRNENGKKITIKDVKVKINITLPNDGDGVTYTPLNRSTTDKRFFWYGFSVDKDHYNELVMLKIKNTSPSGKQPEATFYVKFGGKVSHTNYHYKHPLEGDCVRCSGYAMDIQVRRDDNSFVVFLRDEKLLRSTKGAVSIGLRVCLRAHCKPEDQDYNVFVQGISCRYWNHSEWLKYGCEVGLRSTPLRTVCQCDHLTAFSSYIVRPNPLTKFSVEDFEQGYVTFVTVTIIFIFYVIILIWARRADRSDCSKVGVCALSDNGAQDRYRYEIAIWTGMRRNAGTSSEVNIILSGEKNDSEPRCLLNPQNRNFARGSMEKFLLTSSKEIGSLYCIRIWHDNSEGSWYLSRVMVTDLQKDERYYFICDRWLAVDEDDGQVERLLPVASDEELADFHHLFYTKTKRGLSDTHLWISVLNRPPQSTFTRVQRLSCCLCIVMATMCANAMFYEAQSEPTASATNFVGSYSFTWQEVYIGIVSSLIIVPVNVIILHIFRNARPRAARKSQRQSNALLPRSGYDNIRTSHSSLDTLEESPGKTPRDNTTDDTGDIYSPLPSAELKKKRKKKLSQWEKFKQIIFPSSLPHWFVYVGWAILVLVTLGSATVVVLYGMQFGNGRSLQWLFSIIVSICEDIFVLQPLKVLVFALGFALIIKKPDESEFGMSEYYDDDDDDSTSQRADAGNDIRDKKVPSTPRLPIRPTEEQLAIMRKARVKERKMFFLIQEIIVHLIFTIIIGLVTYGHKDTRAVYMYRHMDRLSKMTDKVDNFTHFWNWSRQVLIPNALPEKLYNGRYVQHYGFMDDGVNNLISRARMRLLRVKNESCKVPEEMRGYLDFCLKDYSIFNEDEKCYGPRWKANVKGKKMSPWCFQDWRDLDGYPTWGIFDTYSGSGYINELIPGSDNNETANQLESLHWLNRQTRAVFVELTTYNANINLYTAISLLFEFPEFGGISYFKNIMPMRLKLYVGGFAFFIFACEMVFVLFILCYTFIACKKIYHHGMRYFTDFWNALDFAILLSSYAAIGVYVYRIDVTTELMQKVKERDGEFVNFQYVSYWNEVLNCIMALVVALTTVKLTKLMRFNLRISLFGKTLQHAKPALIGFSIQFGIVFFAFIMVGVLVFGYNVSQFKSIPSAIMALGRVILGKSQFRELFSADRVIGPIFFLTYVMFVCWILVTMFVAILTDSYHEVQDRCFGMTNDYEIVDFILARVRTWAGLGRKKKLIPAEQRWRNAKIKAKAAAALGRQRAYKPSEEDIAYEKTGDLMEKLEDSITSIEKRVNHLAISFRLETLD